MLAIIVVAVAVVVVVVLDPFRPEEKPPTAIVTKGSIEVTVELSGTVEPEQVRTVAFSIPGTVAEVSVSEQQEVRAGDPLAKLDTSTLEVQERAAEAALTSARSRYVADRDETTEDLPDAVRTATLDADRAAVLSAQASLAQVRETLRNAAITAPIGGTVTDVGLEVGQHVAGTAGPVAPGSSGLSGRIEIQDLADLRVAAEASEIDLPKLSVGQAATVALDALEDARLDGTVCEIGRIGTQVEGVTNYEVTVCLKTAEQRLRVVGGLAVQGILGSQSPVVTHMARGVAREEKTI